MRVSGSALTPGFTTTTASVTNVATTLPIADFSGFPASGSYTIMVDAEQMTVTAGQGTLSWTVTRASGGTTATTHASGASVFQCATTLIPIEPVFFEPFVARYDPALMRNSFEKFYESIIVSEHTELKGVKLPASYEILTNILQFAVKGSVTPTVTTGVATWTFTPSLTVDDLSGLGAEMGNDTQAYHMAAMYCDQMVIEHVRGTDSSQVTLDFMGQQAFQMGAKTPGLTRTGLNLINPANTATFIDTATIGTTAFNDMASAKLTLKNGIMQLYFLNSKLYPTGIARPTRNLDVELVQWFDSATELANAMNAVGNGVERKVRLTSTGPLIPTTATNMSLTTDAYLYWDTFPFKVDKEVWHVTFTGRSVFDVTAGNSWSMTLVNGITALP